jgi:hypothetical protein
MRRKWRQSATRRSRPNGEVKGSYTNAYKKGGHFDLPPGLIEVDREQNDGRGFAYAVFERRAHGQVREIVIAYRGTEPKTWQDWFFGNLLGSRTREG